MNKKVVVGFLLLLLVLVVGLLVLVMGLLLWRPWAPRPTTMPQPPVPTATADLQQLIQEAVATAMAQGQVQLTPTAQQPTTTYQQTAQTVTAMPMSATTVVPTMVSIHSGSSDVNEVFRAASALAYPVLIPPDPARQPVFPDVPYGSRPALVAYEAPFEDGDFCDSTPCSMDLPQFYYRVMTAGEVTIPGLGVSCIATERKGCLVIVINHFGPTAMWRGNTIDHGFTIAGRVWDMSSPELVAMAAQALTDHYVYRMTAVEDGANCGTINACQSVEWHVIVIGNTEVQVHWTGLFHR